MFAVFITLKQLCVLTLKILLPVWSIVVEESEMLKARAHRGMLHGFFPSPFSIKTWLWNLPNTGLNLFNCLQLLSQMTCSEHVTACTFNFCNMDRFQEAFTGWMFYVLYCISCSLRRNLVSNRIWTSINQENVACLHFVTNFTLAGCSCTLYPQIY